MKNPSINPAIITIKNLFVFARVLPIIFPIGVIPISTPAKNIDKPIIINAAPIKNLSNKGLSIGIIVKCSINTIIVIGSTANSTSFNFSVTKFKYVSSPFYYIIYIRLIFVFNYLIILYFLLKTLQISPPS